MAVPSAGTVVLIPFPFSDLSQYKVRPALCLAEPSAQDVLLCQITSKGYGDPAAVALGLRDFASGGLRIASFARPGKLFTAESGLAVKQIGQVTPAKLTEVVESLIRLLRSP